MAFSTASLFSSLSSLSLSTPPPSQWPPLPPLSVHFHLSSPTSPPTPALSLIAKYFKTSLSPVPRHDPNSCLSDDSLSVLYPLSVYSNTLFFKSGNFNVQVVPEEDEDEDSLVERFRRASLRARVLQECKRRRWHETNQEKRKRKSQEAARRYGARRYRRPESIKQPEVQFKHSADEDDDDAVDNWEISDVEVPYCRS